MQKENNASKIVKQKIEKFNHNSFKTTEVLFLIILTAMISLLVGYLLNNKNINLSSNDANLKEIIDNYNYIVKNYYETIDKSKVVSGAIDGMINSLGDEYSQLLEENTSSNFYINLEGSYDGIGIEITNNDDNNIVIVGVLENSPAEKAGLKSGDIVKQIDDKIFENCDIKELTKYIKENRKKSYHLVILRDNNEMEFDISKDEVTIKSVLSKVFEKENKKIGYIYISVFSNNTSKQFKSVLKELEDQNIDSLIIDVRENSGGHLTTAVSLLSNFLDSSHVIYQTEKNGKKTKFYSTGDQTKKYSIVVLQNKNSASASELLGSTLKEEYGATVIGETSYGKGTIQEVVNLKNGDTYKFTTKKWLTPKGNWIHEKGVEPDIKVSLDENYQNNPCDETDNQLQTAIDYLSNH